MREEAQAFFGLSLRTGRQRGRETRGARETDGWVFQALAASEKRSLWVRLGFSSLSLARALCSRGERQRRRTCCLGHRRPTFM